MGKLTFDQLRAANRERIPQFKNCHGAQAHSSEDGSDWSAAQWLQALVGEVGELCEARVSFEEKWTDTATQYEARVKDMGDEAADVQSYLDIAATRMLDVTWYQEGHPQPALLLVKIMADLGAYANARKKCDRGDYTQEEFLSVARAKLQFVSDSVSELYTACEFEDKVQVLPHPHGIDLGEATVSKFNEVSRRIDCDIKL